MWSKFHQNRPNCVQIKGCVRHTHIHTHTTRGTDMPHPRVNIFSPEIARRHLHQSNIFKNALVTSCFFFRDAVPFSRKTRGKAFESQVLVLLSKAYNIISQGTVSIFSHLTIFFLNYLKEVFINFILFFDRKY